MSGDQLTLLPEESLASLSVWPGSRQAQQMTVTSGQRLLASSRLCGRVGSVLRTLVGSSAWRSTMCLLTWKHKVTPQGRSYYQLQVSVPRIDATEYGSSHIWPTPTANPRPNEGNVRMYRAAVMAGEMTEQEAESILGKSVGEAQGKIPELLPTPNASKAGNDLTLTCSGDGREKPNKLGWAVASMLPTPNARDHKDTGENTDYEKIAAKSKLAGVAVMYPTPDANPEKYRLQGNSQQSNSLEAQARQGRLANPGKLNPDWVSRMMGFPDGWLDLSIPAGEAIR
jgi:hypothetical protein